MKGINLNTPEILSSSEACFLWGIDDSSLRKKSSKFPEGAIRRVGKQWIVTASGMTMVFGKPNPKQKFTEKNILELYHSLKKIIQEQKDLSLAGQVKFCIKYLERQGNDKTFATSLAEAVCGKYDLSLLLDIFTTEKS